MSSDSVLNSLQFSFYSPDEIRRISVQEITSLISFEPTLGKGAVGGVYDSILGSLSDRESCRNCNLSYYECNGHFGHIEFPKPIYNPMLFDYLVKLIKATCFYCHKLNLSQGLGESIVSLGSNDSCLSIQRYHQLDELRSLTVTDKEKQAIKIMSSQLRRKCVNCGKSPLVFSKSRKCEILVHVGKKMRKSGDEPEEKKRKMNDSLAAYDSAYSEDVLYGSFVETDAPISPDVIREHLRILWSKENENLKLIFPILKMGNFEYPTDVFFMDNMLINPPMNRLPAHLHDGQMTESPETANMVNVVRASFALREVLKKTESVNEKQRYQNIREGILELQKRVNISYDSNMHREIRDAQPGLRQRIDKKTGLFRENIMGKRVNFSCRSVISPDPNVGLNEIGVPIVFLSKLTFPEHMNNLNKEFLKQCVLNGPNVYPGAVSYQIDGAAPVAIFSDCESIVEYIDLKFQEKRKVVVNRHAISGDVLIMNRQPTLHKPSMQAHIIKAILDPKAKTLRMHYSNCKAYNADFDGDEMNGHFLQSLHAKSEAKHIVNACYQHSTPKDGSPLSGLIQDHIIAGTRMCMRDCFLERHEYIDLVFNGIGITGVKVKLLKPAIMKPKQLWTGKQVLSTILINSINSGVELPNIVCYEPKKKALWKTSKLEDKDKLSDIDLIIIDGYVCTGIFDKVHLGPAQKGLRSDIRELYGSFVEMQILTNLSRLLNRYLIYTGFSTSFKDGLVDKRGNTIRETAKNDMKLFGVMAIANAFKINCNELTQEKIAALMEKAQFDKSDEYRNKMKDVDVQFKLLSGQLVNKLGIQKKHLKVQFPENNLSFMSNTGAKGNDSNLTKIACALGAIEIEGKRCPLTIAGRTLPSFKRYDSNPAARGFCINRFSTGLTPQEIFFESMAGRDGLVDTAVKTSSSGYLQRCVIKQLEDIVVAHDYTVRDNMDNIIQFKYGYDGLDVVNSVFLSKPDLMEVFGRNLVLMKKKYLTRELSNDSSNSDLPITIQQRIDTMVSKLKDDNINLTCVEVSELKEIIKRRCQIALCSPGEAVGLLAAQSIGEPSTQMTLNTFHNAGQSDMNVTLGIPRLREILMTSSENIKTPSMTVPILGTQFAKNNVPVVLKKFNKLLLKDVIELPFPLTVNRYMEITFNFKSESSYRDLTNLSRRELITIIERTFVKSLAKALKKYSGSSSAEIKQEKDNDDRAVVIEMEVDNDQEPDEKEKDDDTDDDSSDRSDAKSNHDAEEEGEEDEEESDEDDNENDNDDNQSTKEATTESGITNTEVVEMCPAFKDYQIHKSKKPKWIKLILNIYNCNIDLKSLILQLLETTVLSSIDGIEKALIIAKDNCFATEGYNISELFKYDQVFDLNQFYSNNIQKMAKLYGVEVAVKCLEIEIAKVFGAYGIDVNSRHLRLIADYLTTSGRVGGFNRNSMKNHPSQIQRASFETALKVLNEMMVHGNKDFIKSPSANIMLGQPVSNIGTNSVHLLYDMSA